MRNADCGISVKGRSPHEPHSYIPHSAFHIPHFGLGGAVGNSSHGWPRRAPNREKRSSCPWEGRRSSSLPSGSPFSRSTPTRTAGCCSSASRRWARSSHCRRKPSCRSSAAPAGGCGGSRRGLGWGRGGGGGGGRERGGG